MSIFGIAVTTMQGLALIVLGGGVLIGAIAGGIVLLARAIYNSVESSRQEDNRRAQQWKEAKARLEQREDMKEHNQKRQPRRNYGDAKREEFTSTNELQQGDVVYLRSGQWRVTGKIPTPVGMRIALRNVANGQMAYPKVKRSELDQKVWSLRPRDWSK